MISFSSWRETAHKLYRKTHRIGERLKTKSTHPLRQDLSLSEAKCKGSTATPTWLPCYLARLKKCKFLAVSPQIKITMQTFKSHPAKVKIMFITKARWCSTDTHTGSHWSGLPPYPSSILAKESQQQLVCIQNLHRGTVKMTKGTKTFPHTVTVPW